MSPPESMVEAPVARARWPWFVLAAFIAIAVVGTVLVAANDEPMGAQVPYIIAFSMFGAVGATIVTRDRRNAVGVLLLWGCFTTAMSFTSGELATWLFERGDAGLVTQLFGLLSGFGWLFGILPVLFLLPLLFPDGHLPSPRWKPFLWWIVGMQFVLFIALTLGASTVSTSSDTIVLDNPLYIDALGRFAIPDAAFAVLYFGTWAVSVASVFMRFRRAGGVERQQIKWVAFGLLAAFIAIALSDFVEDATLSAIVGGVGFLAFPISIGVAVLRFHLYDLDVVVKRTVVYAALALFATLVYLAVVVGVGAWLGRGSSLLTMVAAVIVAVTFQPVRARLTKLADRLVYGRRATPYEVLADFAERVGEAYRDDDLLPRMARVLGEGVGAERADVWLKVDDGLRDVAVWPADAARLGAVPLPGGDVPALEGADRVYRVEHAGELLGALAVRKPASDPISPADDKLISDLASQAGLVLRNVRLTEELRARLDDLRAAQKRIVAAQDRERRRLERNIHDGAQQQLVALAVKARLARTLTERDPVKTAEMLTQIERETQDALEDLRDLARGIYPPLLADKGLAAALEAQARKSLVPIDVRAEDIDRFPQEIEAAVYFSALEALQNVAKYADASRATVTLRRSNGSLAFAVADDGRGFEPSVTGYGTGLQGIADRLGALDGELEVTSRPGSGTTVSGRLPISMGAPDVEGEART
ncbi:MAG: sensor histidine kinase [Actinomycetota bacterium]